MPPIYRKYYDSSEEEARERFVQQSLAIPSAEEEAQLPTTVPRFPPISTGSTLPQPFFKPKSKASRTTQRPKLETKYPNGRNDNISRNIGKNVREKVTPTDCDNANVRHHYNEDLKFDDPEIALAGMDDQFNKWTHARREGIDAFPFVMMGVPDTLHGDIIAADTTFNQVALPPSSNMIDSEELRRSLVKDHRSATITVLIRAQDELVNDEVARRADELLQSAKEAPNNAAKPPKDTLGPSKRAAAIAKAKATASSSSVVEGKSASQRRAAVQQQKKKRSTGNSAASSSKRLEAAAKPNSHADEKEQGSSKTVLRFDSTQESIRSAVASALRQGLVKAESQPEQPLGGGKEGMAKQGSA